MKLSDAIVAGIAGTTAFTLFSYVVAEKTNRSYEQPKLLGKMINRSGLNIDKKEAAFTGWVLHYLIGITLAMVYKQVINITGLKPGIKNGAIAGAITGIPAIMTWHGSLTMHPAPPRKKSGDYYMELFAGHIVFGVISFLTFRKRKSNASLKSIEKQRRNPGNGTEDCEQAI